MIRPNQGIVYTPVTTFTPTVTLVGGAGNTVPVYTTNTGRYERIGNRIFVEVALNGDGGAEGAGTGVVNIALPVAASASISSLIIPIGQVANGTEEQPLYGLITANGTTLTLYKQSDTAGALTSDIVTVTGADQDSTTRAINARFTYEV